MEKQTTVWLFKATNKRDITPENLVMARKGNLKRETESLLTAAQKTP